MTARESRPINLLELRATYTTGGGPDKTILLSAEKHDKEKVKTVVAYLRDIGDNDFQIGRMAEGRGFTYIEVLDRGKVDIKCIMELNSLVKKYNVDIVHGHDYKTDILAYILGLFNPKVHIVSTSHGWITNTLKGSLYKWIHLKALRRFNNLITVSEATKSLMVESGISDDKIKVIYNGIDDKTWKDTDQHRSLRDEWVIPDNAFVVGTVGRIGDEKDYTTLLNVARAVMDKYSDVYFVVVGEGKEDEKERLIAYAENLQISDKVLFPGFRSDLHRVYKSFDIFLMTSVTEGLPNTMLEAMSMGLPVVTTNVGGIPELLEDGKSGYQYEVGDVDGLSGKIMELISNSALREQLSAAGRNRIETKFSFDKRLQIIEEYYQHICQNA